MPTKSSPQPQPKKFFTCGIFLLAIVGLFLTLVLVIAFRLNSQNQKAEDLKQDLLAQGLPIDDLSLSEYNKPRSKDDISNLWLEVMLQVEQEDFRKASEVVPILSSKVTDPVPSRGQPWKEQVVTEQFLSDFSELRELMEQAATADKATRYTINFDGFDTMLESVQSARSAARFLKLDHDTAAYLGDSSRQTKSIDTLFALANSLDEEPSFVSHLVRIAIMGIGNGALQQTTQEAQLDINQADQLLSRMQQFNNYERAWKRMVAGERAIGLVAFDDPSKIDPSMPSVLSIGRGADKMLYMEIMQMLYDAGEQPITALQPAAAEIETRIRDATSDGLLNQFSYMLTSQIVPATSAVMTAYVRSLMQNRLGILAIGLRKYRDKNGEWPTKLEQLESVGIDLNSTIAASGQQMGYKVIDNKALLWGYNPRTQTEVPTEPHDISALPEGEQEELKMMIWELEP